MAYRSPGSLETGPPAGEENPVSGMRMRRSSSLDNADIVKKIVVSPGSPYLILRSLDAKFQNSVTDCSLRSLH